MEHVAAQEWRADDDTLGAITEAVRHLHSFTRAWPGPACGGEYAGTLWPQDDPISISIRGAPEEYVNSRLAGKQNKISFGDLPLVFIYGGLSPRNILFTAEEMWFIDWEVSGYFPRTTEIAVLQQDRAHSNDDHLFRERLADRNLQVTPLVECEIPLCRYRPILHMIVPPAITCLMRPDPQ